MRKRSAGKPPRRGMRNKATKPEGVKPSSRREARLLRENKIFRKALLESGWLAVDGVWLVPRRKKRG